MVFSNLYKEGDTDAAKRILGYAYNEKLMKMLKEKVGINIEKWQDTPTSKLVNLKGKWKYRHVNQYWFINQFLPDLDDNQQGIRHQ